MASVDSQQTWAPYESTKDCSQGFCSIYCPQWCYIVFPPPPPPFDLTDDSSASTSFSPLVIAIIGILASAFLLVTYYTIISKYCGSFESFHRRLNRASDGDAAGQLRNPEAWRSLVSDGLEESVIRSIGVCKYKKGDGFVEGTDCPVCLADFLEDESLRLLPKCSHAFHVRCIDTWLKSNSNCPLCRAIVISPAAVVPPKLPTASTEREEATENPIEIVIAVEHSEGGGEEEIGRDPKHPSGARDEMGDADGGDGIVENGGDRLQATRRSVSTGVGMMI